VQVFKEKGFARFQRKEGLRDDALCKAIGNVAAGLVDADLGRGLFKQRVARPGQGKRGGYRRSSRIGLKAVPSSCSASPRAARQTSIPMSWMSWLAGVPCGLAQAMR
jgi:RelE toxin of RelE / RelB toxin-antitoxin system